MRWENVPKRVAWLLHIGSGRRLSAAVVDTTNAGFAVRLLASKTAKGARSRPVGVTLAIDEVVNMG